jgi:X-linked retinitis pigmentosa GTPase regulator
MEGTPNMNRGEEEGNKRGLSDAEETLPKRKKVSDFESDSESASSSDESWKPGSESESPNEVTGGIIQTRSRGGLVAMQEADPEILQKADSEVNQESDFSTTTEETSEEEEESEDEEEEEDESDTEDDEYRDDDSFVTSSEDDRSEEEGHDENA